MAFAHRSFAASKSSVATNSSAFLMSSSPLDRARSMTVSAALLLPKMAESSSRMVWGESDATSSSSCV
jgi:hypothetical protein